MKRKISLNAYDSTSIVLENNDISNTGKIEDTSEEFHVPLLVNLTQLSDEDNGENNTVANDERNGHSHTEINSGVLIFGSDRSPRCGILGSLSVCQCTLLNKALRMTL